MKKKFFVLLIIIFLLITAGCENPIQEYINQIEIANQFSNFIPDFADIIKGSGGAFSRQAENALAPVVSMEIDIASAYQGLIPLQENGNFSVRIVLTEVDRAEFINLFTDTEGEEVSDELYSEWEKLHELLNQEIEEVNVYYQETSFSEGSKFNDDNIDNIINIIEVNKTGGSMMVCMEAVINNRKYSGNLAADFVKLESGWKISTIEIELVAEEEIYLSVEPQEVELLSGEDLQLEVIVEPEEAKLSFSSEDEEVAVVDEAGLIAAVDIGKTVITITAVQEGYPDVEKEVTVLVEEKINEYTIYLSADPEEGGSVSGEGTFEEGEDITVEAEAAEGWVFVAWEEDEAEVSTGAAYTFEVEADRTLVAVFEEEDIDEFAGGSGSLEDPYLVETAGQLNNVRNYLDKHFIQVADIDLGEFAGENEWQPIGGYLSQYRFSGTYDGDGHSVINLTIDSPETDSRSLFGTIEDAEIKNLHLKDINIYAESYTASLAARVEGASIIENVSARGEITGYSSTGGLVGLNNGQIINSWTEVKVIGQGNNIGGLVGWNNNYIENCFAEAEVTGTGDYVGGLVGHNNGQITASYSSGNIQGSVWTGGLVGYSSGGNSLITNSYAEGEVNGSAAVGGLVGTLYRGEIQDCYAEGAVEGTENSIGGLVGKNDQAQILSSFASGSVAGEERVGGLVGYQDSHWQNPAVINNCYATGLVAGEENVGGLVGRKAAGSLENSFAIGTVNILDEEAAYYGGLVGRNYTQVNNCYYNAETTRMTDEGKGVPRNTSEMTYPYDDETYINWDFTDIWCEDEESTMNQGYPYLKWQDK